MKQKTFAVRGMLAWLLLAACVILAGWAVLDRYEPAKRTHYAASGIGADIRPIPVQTGALAVNTADAATLDELPGIGPATAEAILAERDLNGPFFYPEDLMQVYGIGEKKLEAFRDMLDLTEE